MSTGTVHTWCIRASDRWRNARTVQADASQNPPSDAYQHALQAANTGR
jgi:hypothetical protein